MKQQSVPETITDLVLGNCQGISMSGNRFESQSSKLEKVVSVKKMYYLGADRLQNFFCLHEPFPFSRQKLEPVFSNGKIQNKIRFYR